MTTAVVSHTPSPFVSRTSASIEPPERPIISSIRSCSGIEYSPPPPLAWSTASQFTNPPTRVFIPFSHIARLKRPSLELTSLMICAIDIIHNTPS